MTEKTPTETRLKSQKKRKAVSQAFWPTVWRRYRSSKMGMLGLGLVLTLILVGVLAPILANNQPVICKFQGEIHMPAVVELVWNIPLVDRIIKKSYPFDQATFNFKKRFNKDKEDGDWVVMPPVAFGWKEQSSAPLQPPSAKHWLGTDEVGRDLMSRMIYGARVSMLVGFVSVGISTLVGLFLGAIAGYFGGVLDILISRVIEIVICFPVFFLILSLMVWVKEPSIWHVMIVIGLVRWTGTARYVRGEFIRLRDAEYTLAAKSLGASHARIIIKHLLPNSLAPLFVTVTFSIAAAISVEAGLSWLGFGVQPPEPSWGNILKKAYENLQTATHLMYPPCVAIFVAVLSYNLVGDSLRDAVDPRVSKS